MSARPVAGEAVDFQVRRADLHDSRFARGALPEPGPGEAVLGVDTFGLTANNITYAVLGETMSYWDFFPAPEGWGRVPVWGFAEVLASEHEDVDAGERIFGYLPPSTHLVVVPDRADEAGFVDATRHRAKLPSAYNGYLRVAADPLHEPRREPERMLLWPLFSTAYLLDDLLAEENSFGGEAVVLSSASSRTASSMAFLISRRGGAELIGLTSPGRVEFVERLDVYDRVVPYDQVGSLPRRPTVYVDIAGDGDVRADVHRHFGEALVHDAAVGVTHHERMGTDPGALAGPAPQLFFAPDRFRKRVKDWGRQGLAARLGEAWRPYVEWTSGWLEVVREDGPAAVERTYRELLEGRSDPAIGHVLSLGR